MGPHQLPELVGVLRGGQPPHPPAPGPFAVPYPFGSQVRVLGVSESGVGEGQREREGEREFSDSLLSWESYMELHRMTP